MSARFALILLLGGTLAACARNQDVDGDGVTAAEDCDDTRADIFPGAPERCDAVDSDCDELGDDADADAPRVSFYADLDGDGFGRAGAPRLACEAPLGFVADDTDCDDGRAEVFPGAPEVCDALDGDCDGVGDDEDPDLVGDTWFLDADGDGYGGAETVSACAAPAGYVAEGADCDDADAAAFPGADDVCGGGDADCDGFDDACVIEGEWSLADMDGTLVGEEPGDAAGSAIVGMDVDADGVGDALIVAPAADDGGAAYLPRGPFGETRALRGADLRIGGEGAGLATIAAGDLDGDGLPEMVVGAPGADGAWIFGAERRGEVGVSAADGALAGVAGEGFATALAAGGDLDGDARGDLVVGAPGAAPAGVTQAGAVYVYGGWTALDAGGVVSTVYGASEGAGVGSAVALVGDLDGDGVIDLAIGAPGDDGAGVDAGAAYVVYGPLLGELSVADADATLQGVLPGDEAGTAVAGVGDIDGDGTADLMVGAPGEDSGGAAAGAAYLVRGPGAGATSLSAAHCILLGLAEGDAVGAVIAGLGDVSGDGRADVALGGSGADRVWLLQGPFAGTFSLVYAEGVLVEGTEGDAAGTALAGGGDFDGDGRPDLLVGSPGADGGGSGAGIVSLVRGWTE